MYKSVMGSRNENGSFVHILLDINLTLQEENISFSNFLYRQKCFIPNNYCRLTPSEDMNEVAAQK